MTMLDDLRAFLREHPNETFATVLISAHIPHFAKRCGELARLAPELVAERVPYTITRGMLRGKQGNHYFWKHADAPMTVARLDQLAAAEVQRIERRLDRIEQILRSQGWDI